MTKYTRREFFKSIIPMGVGIVSFLRGNPPQLRKVINEPFITNHIITTPTNGDDIEWSFEAVSVETTTPPKMYARNSHTLITSIDGGIKWYEIE